MTLDELPKAGFPVPGHLLFVSLSPHPDIPAGAVERGADFFHCLAGGSCLRFQLGDPPLQSLDAGFARACAGVVAEPAHPCQRRDR